MARTVTLRDWIECDGLPRRICNKYRAIEGLEPLPAVNVLPLAADHRKMPAVIRKRTAGGPGTELKRILQELGISAAWCEGCTSRAAQMDRWGVDGCLREIDTIASWLRESAKKQAASTKLAAAWNAAWSMTWVNPLDPYRSLAQRAIDAAREKLAECQTASSEPEPAAANG